MVLDTVLTALHQLGTAPARVRRNVEVWVGAKAPLLGLQREGIGQPLESGERQSAPQSPHSTTHPSLTTHHSPCLTLRHLSAREVERTRAGKEGFFRRGKVTMVVHPAVVSDSADELCECSEAVIKETLHKYDYLVKQ